MHVTSCSRAERGEPDPACCSLCELTLLRAERDRLAKLLAEGEAVRELAIQHFVVAVAQRNDARRAAALWKSRRRRPHARPVAAAAVARRALERVLASLPEED